MNRDGPPPIVYRTAVELVDYAHITRITFWYRIGNTKFRQYIDLNRSMAATLAEQLAVVDEIHRDAIAKDSEVLCGNQIR